MAIIPNDEKVFMVSNTTNTTYSGSQALKDMNEWYTMEDVSNTVKPYKAFSCLLTQKQNPSEETLVQDPLTIGVTYRIVNDPEGVVGDFTNVGAPNNEDGTYFIATGEDPNSWGDSVLEWNMGVPVVQVLENDLGHVWFEFIGSGEFNIVSGNGSFTPGKTAFIDSTSYLPGIDIVAIGYTYLYPDAITFTTSVSNGPDQKLVVRPTFVEIRVYN
jgi:hypothetical protein